MPRLFEHFTDEQLGVLHDALHAATVCRFGDADERELLKESLQQEIRDRQATTSGAGWPD